MKVLITGGAGYIGSTIASACLDAGITPVIVDDLSTGLRAFAEGRIFYEGDIADGPLIDRVFREHPNIAATVHCAAKIVVPDSVVDPLGYYWNNVAKSIVLLNSLQRNGCERFVFSSTASLYLAGANHQVDEESRISPESPYAASKMFVERVLRDLSSTGTMRAVSLRYFNPIGADPRLRTGAQQESPTHLLGRLMAASSNDAPFTVYGTDWPTRDGSALRDFIHVWDLAEAHVRVLQLFDTLFDRTGSRYEVFNLGTGVGTTVLEFVRAFEDSVGHRLEVVVADRRDGDVVGSSARVERAAERLHWSSRLSIGEGISHAIAWRARLARVGSNGDRSSPQSRACWLP